MFIKKIIDLHLELFLIGLVLGGVFVISSVFLIKSTHTISVGEITSVTMKCDSDSMGLVLNCGDKIKMIDYLNESLDLGKIYIYTKGNKSIIHRVVGCIDANCSVVIFKGDNNAVAEFVNKSDIKYKVKEIIYG